MCECVRRGREGGRERGGKEERGRGESGRESGKGVGREGEGERERKRERLFDIPSVHLILITASNPIFRVR